MINQDLSQNSVLQNAKYLIINSIGQGGFGITYLAEHVELKKRVAIKECFVKQWCRRRNQNVDVGVENLINFQGFKSKFLIEAQTLAKFDHKNIVRVSDYFEENETAYFVMEYVEGESLQKIIEKQGKLEQKRAVELIIKISESVKFLHKKGILHRDIKPDNIIIKNSDEPVLLDFGAAREVAGSKLQHTVIQTPGYAPIEQSDRYSPKNYSLDIYSLAATLYHMITGERPLPATQRVTTDNLKDPRLISQNISKRLAEVLLKAMAVKSTERYQSVEDFIFSLTHDSVKVTFDLSESELTDHQILAFREFEKFINNPEEKVFILKGLSNSGKSFIVKQFILYLQSFNIGATLLASTSKIAQSIKIQNKYDRVTSLYTLIYNFNESKSVDVMGTSNSADEINNIEEIEKICYGYKNNYDDPSMVYIIDNAELLSDDYVNFELLKFGTGKLLEDLITYSEIKIGNNNRKIIFVGDNKQLLRGNQNLSSLSTKHIKDKYELNAKAFDLREQNSDSSLETINSNILDLRKSLETGVFNNINLSYDDDSCRELTEESFISHYLSLSPKDTIILEHTNKHAKKINEQVRRVLGREKYLSVGDRVVLHNNINVVDDFNQIFHFSNGEYAEVVELNSEEKYSVSKKNTELTFRNIKLKFENTEKEINVLIIKNYFLSDSTDLNKEELIALRILANQNFSNLSNQEKFNILKSISFAKGITELSEFENNLNLEQKDFNKFLSSKKVLKEIRKFYLRSDKYLSAAKIRYGYCITCHRAQGFKWPNVIVNCENNLPKTNESYFRWLYTAFTRTNANLFIINPPNISPMSKLKFSENINIPITSKIDVLLMPENYVDMNLIQKEIKFSEDRPQLIAFYKILLESLREYCKVDNIDHNNYQECYHIKVKDSIHKIRFGYNRKFHFKKPKSKVPIENEIIDSIFEGKIITQFPDNFLKCIYEILSTQLLDVGIRVQSIEHNNNSEAYTLIRGDEILNCNIYFTDDQFFTTIQILKANSAKLIDDFKTIINTKLK